METPMRGWETPKEGMETPMKGMETPVKSMETPMKGMETPGDEKTHKDEMETPKDGLETPKDGLETLKDGLEILKNRVEAPMSGLKTPKKGLETTTEPRGDLETTVTPCLEQENGGLETTGEAIGSLETTVSLEQENGGLETPLESRGSPETTREVPGTTNGRRGSLETAVSRCLEQGRRSNGGSETTSKAQGGLESDVPPTSRGMKTTSRRKAGLKTPGRAKGSRREQEEGPEPTRAVLGGPEPTPMACVGQSQGGPGLPGPVEVPEPPPVPPPKRQEAEESAVISVGEEEDEEEEEGEEEGPGRYLAALEAVQLQLEAVEEEAARAFRRLRARFGLRRRPHLQRRNRLIQHIPGFWVTAFLNHPQLSAMISDRDEDALSYMTSLQVEEFGQSHPGCRIRFFFGVNPYFQNDVVAKEFVRGPSGHLVSHSTPIRWWQGQDPRSRPHKGPPGPRSFFAWFGDHSFPAGDRVAEV
ncbi:TSYL2 protein, partial [Neopipo cinnamomea]|nr:TSYL2 protein [Neopipo cinnamomea]